MKSVLDIPRTAMEVFNILPEGTLCEVINNTLYMSPSPTTDHQRVLLNISFEIQVSIKANPIGEVFIAPCDVYLDEEKSVVEPDIVFIRKSKSAMVKRKGIYGTPDLIIEILSTNISHDKKRKLALYERNSIPEYIIVDPDTKEVWQYLLINDVYQQQPVVKNGLVYIHQLSLSITF